MKRFLWKAAGVVAVFGVAFCLAGVLRGGHPMSIAVHWQNGLPHISYFTDDSGWRLVAGDPDSRPTDHGSSLPAEAPPAPEAPAAPEAPSIEYADGDREVPGQTVRALDVDVGAAKVVLQPGEDWSLQVKGLQNYSAEVDDGVWEISCNEMTVFGTQDSCLTITFPRDAVLDELDLDIGAGGATVEGLRCQEMDITVAAGGAELRDVVVYGECQLEADVGGITLQGDLQGGADIECGMGGVKCVLVRPRDYGYTVDCGMGGVTIDGVDHGGLAADATVNAAAPVQYDIDCGMGGVEIKFVDG